MAVAAIVAGYDLLWPLIAAPLLLEGFSSLVQARILVPAWRRLVDPRAPDGTPLPYQRFPLPAARGPPALPLGTPGSGPTLHRAALLDQYISGNRGGSRCRARVRRNRPGPRAQRRRRPGVLARRHVAAPRLSSGRRPSRSPSCTAARSKLGPFRLYRRRETIQDRSGWPKPSSCASTSPVNPRTPTSCPNGSTRSVSPSVMSVPLTLPAGLLAGHRQPDSATHPPPGVQCPPTVATASGWSKRAASTP